MKRSRTAVAYAVLACAALAACTPAGSPAERAEPEFVDYGMAGDEDAHAAAWAMKDMTIERSTDALEYKASIAKEAMQIAPLAARLTGEFEQTVEDYTRQAAAMKADSPDVFRAWAYKIEWTPVFSNEEFLSLKGNHYEYSGGAHPNSSYDSILWDRRAERDVELAAFFEDKRAGLRAVANAAKAAFFVEIETRGAAPEPDADADPDEDDLPGWALDGLKPAPDNYDVFILVLSPDAGKAGGIVTLFSPYELGPFVWGGFELFVPASAFRDHLTPRYAELFGADAPAPSPR